MAELAEPLGVGADVTEAPERAQAAVAVMERLVERVGLPTRLQEVGVERAWLPDVATATLSNTRVVANSPVQPGATELTELLDKCLLGATSGGLVHRGATLVLRQSHHGRPKQVDMAACRVGG